MTSTIQPVNPRDDGRLIFSMPGTWHSRRAAPPEGALVGAGVVIRFPSSTRGVGGASGQRTLRARKRAELLDTAPTGNSLSVHGLADLAFSSRRPAVAGEPRESRHARGNHP